MSAAASNYVSHLLNLTIDLKTIDIRFAAGMKRRAINLSTKTNGVRRHVGKSNHTCLCMHMHKGEARTLSPVEKVYFETFASNQKQVLVKSSSFGRKPEAKITGSHQASLERKSCKDPGSGKRM
jgi:hypothetical protein